MPQQVEIECKVLLNSDDFYTLFDHLGLKEEPLEEQINYYFDTEDKFLSKKDISLRVRLNIRSKSYTMTIKIPHKIGKLEINEQIKLNQFEELSNTGILPKGEISSLIGDIPSKLILLASLTTVRCEVEYENGKLALDHNTYNGLQDFELEFEGQSEKHCKIVINQLMLDAGIDFDYNTVSKRARALKSLPKKNKKNKK